MDHALADAINTYHELNASFVDEMLEEPSPLEFMRYVARNRPFVARRVASSWSAVQKWSADYLLYVMGDDEVNVAVTPLGNADAVVEQEDGLLLFVEPLEISESFSEFLEYLRNDTKLAGAARCGRNVKYAQTQNDNLRGEYNDLFKDVPKDIAFARIALDKEADAVNLWIGNDRSVTSLHKDNYENVYVQVRGQKRFVLLPPVEMPCVNEQPLRRAAYRYAASDTVDGRMVIQSSEVDERLPVPTWDPDEPEKRATLYSHLSKPLRVTLNEGDMLYLPAMWYHKVSQVAGEEGFACAVNYWYDMDFAALWPANSFIRDVANASALTVQYPSLAMSD